MILEKDFIDTFDEGDATFFERVKKEAVLSTELWENLLYRRSGKRSERNRLFKYIPAESKIHVGVCTLFILTHNLIWGE